MTSSRTDHCTETPDMAVPQLPAALRSRRWLVGLGVAIGLVVGGFLAETLPTQFTATATVKLGAGFVSAGVVSNDSTAASTEAQVAALRPQIEEIARILDTDADVVASHLSVANRGSTSLMDFTYSAATAKRAERGAQVATEVYLNQALQTARDKLDNRIELLRQQATVAPPENREAIANDLRSLQSTVVDQGSLVRAPWGSAQRSVLVPITYLGLGALGGLILGALLALLAEAARPRIRRGVAVPGMRLLGPITEDTGPKEASEILMPAIVTSGKQEVSLVPLGSGADAVTELISRTLPGVHSIDHMSQDGLQHATDARNVVLVVCEGEHLRSVRSVTAKLAIVDVKVTGIVTVAPGAVELAERVLDDHAVVSPFDSDFANGIFRSGFASW